MYLPSTASLPTPVAAPVTPPQGPGARPSVLVVTPFVDARHDRGRCGMKKNGWGGDSADIFCSHAPGAWLARRLVDDLRAAGVDARTPPESADVRLEGELMVFFTEPLPSVFSVDLETDIQLRLTATTSDGMIVDRQIYVKGVETSSGPTDAAIQASVDDASGKVTREMVVSVVALLDRRAAEHAARSSGGPR